MINMLSEFIWHTLHLTQTSESIQAQGLFRLCGEAKNTTACSEREINSNVSYDEGKSLQLQRLFEIVS